MFDQLFYDKLNRLQVACPVDRILRQISEKYNLQRLVGEKISN